MSDDLAVLEKDWDAAAESDAFFNIMTVGGMTPEEFWETGEAEIANVIDYVIDDLGVDIDSVEALDFGCGIGRLTRPLSKRFIRATGVDISEVMLTKAKHFASRPRYLHNNAPDLAIFDHNTFDFIYSSIVLQHMHPVLAEGYVREFIRVLHPDGCLVFQLPQGPSAVGGHHSMYGTPREVVEAWLEDGKLLDVTTNEAAGNGFTSYRYAVTK